jgi:hypothetical protein
MDGFRAVRQITVAVLGLVMRAIALLMTIAIVAFNDLDGRVDAILKHLTEEFRSMRAETAAQTTDPRRRLRGGDFQRGIKAGFRAASRKPLSTHEYAR